MPQIWVEKELQIQEHGPWAILNHINTNNFKKMTGDDYATFLQDFRNPLRPKSELLSSDHDSAIKKRSTIFDIIINKNKDLQGQDDNRSKQKKTQIPYKLLQLGEGMFP